MKITTNRKQTKIQLRNFALEAATGAPSPESDQNPVIAASARRSLIVKSTRGADRRVLSEFRRCAKRQYRDRRSVAQRTGR